MLRADAAVSEFRVLHAVIRAENGDAPVEHAHLGDLYAESGQTLRGSFSAVSKPNVASKYSLESSRRDLHNALLCTVLESVVENVL